MTLFEYLFFWNFKKPGDNDWHPRVGQNTKKDIENLPGFLRRTDPETTLVDAAPFVASIGAFRHASQMFSFGFTAHANVFRNPKTMSAVHRSVVLFAPLILVLQGAGVEYRNFIPRWCHKRERQRNKAEVRQHVDASAYLKSLSWVARMAFRVGIRY